MLRKEITSSKQECSRYQKQINKSRREAEVQNKDYQATVADQRETQQLLQKATVGRP